MSLASKLPWTHRFAGGYPGLSSQPLPTDADAIDYLSRMAAADGAGVETGVAVAVDAFFRDTKAAGVFDALKACCILAGARTLAGALVPVVGDAPTNVADGFVEGDFSRTSGLTGDGTSYIDSGRANNADPQNDKHISIYLTGSLDIASFPIGDSTNTGRSDIYFSTSDTTIRINGSGGLAVRPNPTSGLVAGTRSASDSFDTIVSGTAENQAGVSETPSSNNIAVFARNNSGTVDGFTTSTLAFYSIGTSLSLADLDTAVTNLINRLKFALLVGENPSGLDPDTIDYIVRGYEAGGTLE